jgi:hypothetical protein
MNQVDCLETFSYCKRIIVAEVFISHNNKILVKEVQTLKSLQQRICNKDILRNQPENILQSSQTPPPPLPSSSHPKVENSTNLADGNVRSLVDASLGGTLAESRRLLVVVVGTLVLLADVLDRLYAGLCDGCC